MDDDRALYRRWLDARDAAAFSTLVRRHADLVHDVAWRVSGDRAAAEDAFQEALARLASDGTDRPADVGIRSWLARIAIDRARNARRADRARGRRERTVGLSGPDRAVAGEEGTVEANRITDTETVAAVDAALRRADPDDAALLTLRYRHGVEYPELAAIFDVPEGTVRVRVHRAVAALRRDESLARRNEPRIERALAVVPLLPCSTIFLESAVSIAVGSIGAAAATGAATSVAAVAARAISPALRSTFIGLGVLALAGGVLLVPRLFEQSDGGRDPRPNRRITDASGEEASGPDLAAPPRAESSMAWDAADAAAAERVPSWTAPERAVPAPDRNPAKPRQIHPARTVWIRAELSEVGRVPVPLQIAGLWMRGEKVAGPADAPAALALQPGERVDVVTDDPRALVRRLRVRVSDPVPDQLVARFPSDTDPRFDRLVLELEDSLTGSPVAGASLDWIGPGSRAPTSNSDSDGRIVIPAATSADGSRELGIRAFVSRAFTIHAPGYRSICQTVLDSALEQRDLDSWRERGTWRVLLEPLSSGFESKSLRVLLADGRSALGAVAHVTYVPPKSMLVALGSAVQATDITDGIRRVGPDGRIEFPARTRVAIEVFIDDCPVGVFALSRDRWPAVGPREVRLSPLAAMTVVLDGVPGGKSLWWGFDPLGGARSPADGSIVPATWDSGFDPATKDDQYLIATGLVIPDLFGDLKEGRNEIHFLYPVGWSRPLYFAVDGDRRQFAVSAPRAGPVRIDARWSELEAWSGRR